MKVLISGGSGFIGRRLAESLASDGHDVVVLSRQLVMKDPPKDVRYVTWDARSAHGDWVRELAGAQSVVNLAGTSIGSWPWTRQRMAELLSSRLSATAALVEALERTPADRRPAVLVSASGIDYYGDRGTEGRAAGRPGRPDPHRDGVRPRGARLSTVDAAISVLHRRSAGQRPAVVYLDSHRRHRRDLSAGARGYARERSGQRGGTGYQARAGYRQGNRSRTASSGGVSSAGVCAQARAGQRGAAPVARPPR